MPKYKAPFGQTGVNIAGAQFSADADGFITVPDGNYNDLLTPLGYVLQAHDALPEIAVPALEIPVPETPAPETTAPIAEPAPETPAPSAP